MGSESAGRSGRGGTAGSGLVSTGARKWLRLEFLLPVAAVVLGALLLLGPTFTNVLYAFTARGTEVLTPSLANFGQLFSTPRFWTALRNTLAAATGATILSCVFGLALAWIVGRTNVPMRSWFGTLNLVTFFMSPFVGAVAWLILAAPRSGILNRFAADVFGLPNDLFNIYSIGGVIWVLALFYTPYVYLFVIGPLSTMDPALEDAARTHGAGLFATIRRVTLPLIAPSLLSGALIVFVTSAGLFDIPIALAAPQNIPMLPTYIYQAMQWPVDHNRAASIGVLLMTVTIVGILFQRLYLGKRNYATVSGKAYRARRIDLGRWRWAAFGVEVIYLLAGVVLPLLALLAVSVSRFWTGSLQPHLLTLQNYSYVIFDYELAQRALLNSFILAVVGATIAVILCTFQAYFITRGKSRWTGLAEVLVSLPLGIPGIVLGLGFLILLIRTPLYGTLWIILIAYVTRFMPFVQRNVSSMILSLGRELEESARMSGASWWQSFSRILLPLLRPAIIAAWLMLFVIYIRELSSSVLLYAQGTETFTVAMLIISEQNLGYVAALAVIQTAILLFAVTLIRGLTRSEQLSI